MGNLADLGLGDIFQIVSLSRRSGTLQLTTPNDSGEIVFNAGRVVAVYCTTTKRTVGDTLLEKGIVTAATYQEMLGAQAAGVVGGELFARFGIGAEALEELMGELLKEVIYDMFAWEEGTFSFVLGEQLDPWRGFALTSSRAVVQHGMSPQYLAIEGARVHDERTQEDSLESFLARDKPKNPAVKLQRAPEAATLAAQLRDDASVVPPPSIPSPSEPLAPPVMATSPQVVIPTDVAALPLARAPIPDATPGSEPTIPPPAPVVPAPPKPVLVVPAPPVPVLEVAAAVPVTVPITAPAASSVAPIVAVARPQPAPPTATALGDLKLLGDTAKAWRLLIIDDDPQVTKLLETQLGGQFKAVNTANVVREAFLEIHANPYGLVVASDLIIARSDGGGILGGLEITERVRALLPPIPVILFSDYENSEAEAKARRMGVTAFLMKPRKAQLQAAKEPTAGPLGAFLMQLTSALADATAVPPEALPPDAVGADVLPVAAAVLPVVAPISEGMGLEPLIAPSLSATPEPTTAVLEPAVAVPEPVAASPEPVAASPEQSAVVAAPAMVAPTLEPASYDLRLEMASLLEDVNVPGSADLPQAVHLDGPMEFLRSMLGELLEPHNRDNITLLVLRFASAMFERAAIMLVTRRVYVGLGGFSVEEASDAFVKRVRRLQVPVDHDSVLAKVVRFRTSIRGPLEHVEGNERLVQGLGGTWPASDAVALPLISSDRVAAILYGDNPSGKPLAATETLDIFLQQAGMAMDRVLLERKLEESRRPKRSDGKAG